MIKLIGEQLVSAMTVAGISDPALEQVIGRGSSASIVVET